MRSIVIVGGKLQGMEACYLGKKAGIHVTLIDRDPQAPAESMASEFICGDVLTNDARVAEALKSADMVLPTLENYEVLSALDIQSRELGFIYAFDLDAYRISSSKKKSDKLFHDNGIAAPKYYPEGSFPYFAKPDGESGSHNVKLINNMVELEAHMAAGDEDMIVQEYIEGPSYSIEVIGEPGNYRTYEITQIHIDDVYDCCRVTSPCGIPAPKAEKFAEDAVKTAEIIGLRGIMDFEVIDHDGVFKMLEIDARLPSQTPTAVYHTTGDNYLEDLYQLFVEGGFQGSDDSRNSREKRYTSFEHLLISGGEITAHGEHIMTEGRNMVSMENSFGSDNAVTDFCEDEDTWRITLINSADTEEELEKKREGAFACLRNIR